MLQLVSDKTQTLKEFTENNYAQGSFFWNTLLKNKDIKVNGKRVDSDILLSSGDTVTYYLTAKQTEKPAFYVVYEDENVLIADKESGVNSEAVFAALSRERECYFIHRLDRNTKGLIAFALHTEAERELLSAFKEKRAEKKYHALLFGTLKNQGKILTAYLKKDAEKSRVQIYDAPVAGSEKIVTEYRVLDTTADGLTRVEITLHTGKTHQIRAHFAHIGCPIAGDMKYGNSSQNKTFHATRQCLVAKTLRFELYGKLSYLSDREFSSRFQAELPK